LCHHFDNSPGIQHMPSLGLEGVVLVTEMIIHSAAYTCIMYAMVFVL
jgi:hypothetical protein